MTTQLARSELPHILMCPFPTFWGHIKTSITFACKLLQERPDIIVTFITLGDYTKQVESEAEQLFIRRNTSGKPNLHILHLGGEGKSPVDLMICLMQNFPSLCNTLLSSQESIQSFNGTILEHRRKPDVFICDVFLLDISKTFRSIFGDTVPVVAYMSPSIGGALLHMGPQALDGPGDVPSRAKALALETGRTAAEIEIELYQPIKGEVVHFFDGVSQYDYERFPQGKNEDPDFPMIVEMLNKIHQLFLESDGIIFGGSNIVLEGGAIQACMKWCSEAHKPSYVVGPLFLEQDQVAAIRYRSRDPSEEGAKVQRFLDKIYESHGKKSLIYIALGTVNWPAGSGLWNVIEVVLEMKIPLIFSYDSTRHSEMPLKLKEDLGSSGLALVEPWLPQELILSHEVTGFFLTHCGPGSLIESISQCVPVIGYPLQGEQAYNAALCSLVLNIGYELVEVRKGVGLKPLYRGVQPTGTPEAIAKEIRTVLTEAFGDDGEEKRRNIEVLWDNMSDLWMEGGASLNDMRRFIADFIPKRAE